MLPFDNKPEFSVVVDMPEGTALPADRQHWPAMLAETLRAIPEVTALQTYAGTAQPVRLQRHGASLLSARQTLAGRGPGAAAAQDEA